MKAHLWNGLSLVLVMVVWSGCSGNGDDLGMLDAGDTEGAGGDTDRRNETEIDGEDSEIHVPDTGEDSDTDKGQESDSETQVLEDSESESVTEQDPDTEETDSQTVEPHNAYFLVDTVGLGNKDVGCDLNGDGKVNNNLAAMIKDFIDLGVLDGDPSAEIQAEITKGNVLIVLKMSDVHSFQDDDQILLEQFRGTLEGGESPSEDLFSGHGFVGIEASASSQFEDSFIEDSWIRTQDRPLILPISIAGEVVNVELPLGRVQANVAGIPDEEMLNGRLDSGLFCGGIEKQYLINLLIEKAGLDDPISIAVAKAAIGGRVDLRCGDKSCISVGVVFSAVSVGIQ